MRLTHLALGLCLLSCLACGPKVNPGLTATVRFHSPSHPVELIPPRHSRRAAAAEAGRKDTVEVVFDRAVVPADKINQPLAKPPLQLSPPQPGTTVWTNERTLVFTFEQPAPRSTAFAAVLPAGLVALDGKGLAKDLVQRFETQRLTVIPRIRSNRENAYDSKPFRWADTAQEIMLNFNQPVRPEQVEKHCKFSGSGGTIDARIQGQTVEPSERFVVVPAKALQLDSAFTFACGEGLVGTEGPLGLQQLARDAGAAESSALAFRTYGAMTLESVSPADQEVDPDKLQIEIVFANPVGKAPYPIKIEPAVDGFSLTPLFNRLTYSEHRFAPNTTYKVTVEPGIEDVFSQTTKDGKTFTFRTGSSTPRFDVSTGSWVVEAARGAYPVWVRNLEKLDVTALAVPESKVTELFPLLNWWDQELADLSTLKLKPKQLSLDARGPHNDWKQVQLGPELLGGSTPKTGFFYFAVTSPQVPPPEKDAPVPSAELLVNVTNLGVTTKLAGSAGLVWVTALDTGKPVAGADVVIRDRDNKTKWKGKTGPDGTVVTPGRATLQPWKRRQPEPQAELENEMIDEGDFDGEGGPSQETPGLLVFVRLGSDVTFANPDKPGRLEPWNFNVPSDTGARRERLRGFIHTDRGLYRPGETVRLRGLVRVMKLGQGLRVPAGKRSVKVTVLDPKRGQVLRKSAALSSYGGWNLDVKLSAAAALGDYSVTAELPDGSFRESFSVEEFRAATMEAKVTAKGERFVVGETVHAKVAAQYLYGSPVRSGLARFRMHLRPHVIVFPELPGFSFDDDVADAHPGYGEPQEELLTEAEQKLGKTGEATLRLPLPKGSFDRPRDLMIAAEVSDETNQSVTANTVVPVYPSRVLFGLETGSPLIGVDKPSQVKLVAVAPDGKRVASTAKVTFTRNEYHCAWEVFGYDGHYRCETKNTEIFSRKVDVPAAAPALVQLAPPASGDYSLVVEGKDGAGNPFRVSRYLWAWGAGEASWPVDEAGRFSMVADKPSYQVGDVAHLLVRTGLKDSSALLTIEREGVLERKLVQLTAGGTLDVPITDAYAPNVYASLMVVRGRTGKGKRHMPTARMGLVNLPVDAGHKRLKVEVATDRESYRPGEKVTASVKLTDGSGKPVRGEVALFAADEGVLSLIAFKTPDPFATFYAAWGLGVATASQYDRLARLPDPDEKVYATGGDGAGKLGTLRSRFMATAYWNPRVETNDQGQAEVTFEAPDNLTAFRVMAVAADAGDRFGAGDRRFTVRKPLQLVAALPRFLDVGDEARGGVMVINETGQAGQAEVKAQVKGAKLVGEHRKTVSLANGARALVTFPMKAEAPGTVVFTCTANLGKENDGLKTQLPIRYPTSVEMTLVAAANTEKRIEIPVALPEGTLPGTAELDLSIDPDGLAGIEEGLRALIEYPYGCLEQTTSRLIPLVAVEEVTRALGLPELAGDRLQRYIHAGIEKLYGFQTDSGGFSLWRGGQPETYLTAFGLWGLTVAKEAGHPVDKRRLQAGLEYLRRAVGTGDASPGIHDELGQEGSRAFALHILALLGQPQPGFVNKMLETVNQLPRFGEAFLARALAASLGKEHAEVTKIVNRLLGASRKNADGMIVPELPDERLYYYYSSDTRTSAIVTDMLTSLRPDAAELPSLVTGLLASRRDGRWDTTQENLYALVALTHYLKNRPAQPTNASVSVAGKSIFKDALPQTGAARVRHFTVPLAGPTALVIEPSEGKVFYQARLRYRRDIEHQPGIDQGVTLDTEFLDPNNGTAIAQIKAGQTVKIRVSLMLPEERSHLAVSAYLPAGLELMNARFVTTTPQIERPDYVPGEAWSSLSSRALHDERVDLFYDYIGKGKTTSELFARATTAGSYVVPASTAEEMYKPERRGRTTMRAFTVIEK